MELSIYTIATILGKKYSYMRVCTKCTSIGFEILPNWNNASIFTTISRKIDGEWRVVKT